MDPQQLLEKAYDPEAFRRLGHQLIDQLADRLANPSQRPAISYTPPDQNLDQWSYDLETGKREQPLELLQRALDEGVQLHHPQYLGHQISPPAPITTLAGLVNDFMNNGMGVYEMGQVGTTLERVVIRLVAGHLGFGEGADGVLTSGGTLANLTALLTARSVKASEPVWSEGSHKKYALMVSEQAHYCVDRAVRIMGWGSDGIIKVPCDEHYRIRTDLLENYLAEAHAQGKEVIAVVGSACSTATGSFDDLTAMADFCARHDLWFHVDGAHGAATAFSPRYRHLVAGLEKADSVAMDFHKMLITPALATALIYRNGQHSYRTFAQKAAYLWESQEDTEWFNLARRTFECTKAMYSLKFYSLYRTYGPKLLDAYVTRVIDTTRAFAQKLEEAPDFRLAILPQCNIICFRYQPRHITDPTSLNDLNGQLRQALLTDGHYYIVQTQIQEKRYLRCTLTNPFTRDVHTQGLIDRIRALAPACLPVSP